MLVAAPGAVPGADRLPRPDTALATAALTPENGWCDDPGDPAYNRPVRLPYAGRHERLWRADPIYDVIVVLGHNEDPPVPDKGSAIFLHLARAASAMRARTSGRFWAMRFTSRRRLPP